MEGFQSILNGISVALQPVNVFTCFIGCVMGTLVGVLPGLGPTAAIAILLPATFRLSPIPAIIMLAGIYYGAMYGGSTTSILVNIPGEAASVITCLDGYKMAMQGRAGPALGISAFGSFIAGTLSIFGLILLAPTLSNLALSFGPPEYFSLMCMGLTLLVYLASGSMIKALMMAALGIILACVGADVLTNARRFTFGIPELIEGIGLVPLVMGLFGVSEVLVNIESTTKEEVVKTSPKLKHLLPTLKDWAESKWSIIRGFLIGFSLGIIPGTGPTMATFLSYTVEKKFSKHPERFGNGAIEGVAGPETANNAHVGASFIPLFSLGIPCNSVIAILLAALMIHGVRPGPTMIVDYPDLFWGVVMSMYIGNIMLLILNLPLIGIWVKVLKIPSKFLYPLILLLCLIGAYSIENKAIDVYMVVSFGLLGFFLRKFRFELAPLVFTFVVGPLMEHALRQSLIISDGSPAVFFKRPISAAIISVAIVFLFLPLITMTIKKHKNFVRAK